MVHFALPGVRKGFIKNKALELVLSKSSTRKKWGGMVAGRGVACVGIPKIRTAGPEEGSH